MTPSKIMPTTGGLSSDGSLRIRGPQGPLLFERTGANETPSAQGLKGRVLRGGSGSGPGEGNVNISKVLYV